MIHLLNQVTYISSPSIISVSQASNLDPDLIVVVNVQISYLEFWKQILQFAFFNSLEADVCQFCVCVLIWP